MQAHSDLNVARRIQRSATLGPCALSFDQKRLWAFHHREPGNPLYNFPIGVRMSGLLHVEALQKALDFIIERHQVLRTTFVIEGDIPMQMIGNDCTVNMPFVDLAALPAGQREAELQNVVTEEIRRPFNVGIDPMLRANLVRINKAEHALVLTTNLIAVDAWSMNILLRELSEAYSSYCLGAVPVLPQLAIEYVDFAAWQRQWLQGRVLKSRLAFWEQQFDTRDSFHHLTTDHPRPDRRTHRAAREQFTLPEDLVKSLTAMSQREGASLFMTLMAALQVLLHIRSEHEQIVVGTCVANRHRLETENLIGLFANDVVLKTDLKANPTFRELLSRVRQTALMAYAHQDVPIGKLVEELEPNRDLSQNPLFQTTLVFQDDPIPLLRLPGLVLSELDLEIDTAQFDLTVLVERRRGLRTTFEYNTDLFEATTIKRVMEDYRAVLQAAVSNPEERVVNLLRTPARHPCSRRTDGASIKEFAIPKDPTEAMLVNIWESVFGARQIGIRNNFFELGGDSLQATKLLLRVEEALGKKLSIASLFQAPTIEQFALLIRSSHTASEPVQVVPIQPKGNRSPFFCVSISGGGPMYRLLSQQLGEDQPFLGLDLQPILATHLDAPYRLQDIAAHVAKALRDQQPEGPYLLGGLCVAGLIAYEAARQLMAEGQHVSMVALFECDYPTSWSEFAPRHTQVAWLAKRLALSKLRGHLTKLAQLELGEAPTYVGSRLTSVLRSARNIAWQSALDIRSHLNGGRLQDLDQIVYLAAKAYQPQLFEGPVVLFQSSERLKKDHEDPLGGWRQVVHGDIDFYEVPGGYWEIYREPNVRILARALSHCLSKTRAWQKEDSPPVVTHALR